jgi:Fe-S oxidoreductase
MSQNGLVIDDNRWQELVDLTGGAASVCYQCGVCTAVCPWTEVRSEPLSVRTMIRQAQLGFLAEKPELWLCATCAQCETYCPRGVDICGVIRGLRYLAWKQRAIPSGLPSLLWSIYWNNNPWTQPPSLRAQWARDQNIPIYDPDEHEILLYIGCTSSYDRRAQNVARALLRLLNVAGVSFGFLGEDEPCCGEAALSVGHKPYFLEIAEETARLFAGKGVTRLVTLSPHCYDVFKNHYPSGPDRFEPIHYTEYLEQLLEAGRLKLTRSLPLQISFHDPCYLTRHNADADTPRRVLAAIPGVEMREMAHAREDALCCGGGGGRMWLETEPGQRFADIRVREALDTGAEILVTACPFCIVCLEDSLKASRVSDLQIMDVAEIAVMALDHSSAN